MQQQLQLANRTLQQGKALTVTGVAISMGERRG
jgi:hypothetical protein